MNIGVLLTPCLWNRIWLVSLCFFLSLAYYHEAMTFIVAKTRFMDLHSLSWWSEWEYLLWDDRCTFNWIKAECSIPDKFLKILALRRYAVRMLCITFLSNRRFRTSFSWKLQLHGLHSYLTQKDQWMTDFRKGNNAVRSTLCRRPLIIKRSIL